MTICVCPKLDVDVMLSMPAIVENCFSRGVATVAAIVAGLVPGSEALTVIVGKSTLGKSLTGNCRYATMPKTRIPTMTSVVMTGRLMNSVVKFIESVAGYRSRATVRNRLRARAREATSEPGLQLVEIRIEDRRHIQRDDLGEGQPTDDRDSQRSA